MIKDELALWQKLYTYYVDNYSWHQLHIVRFENLKTNLEVELRHIMDFLGLKFDKYVVDCLMKKQTGSFKRPKPSIDLKKFFTASQRESIETSKTLVYTMLGII